MSIHRLDLGYEDYLKAGKTIADSQIDKYIIYEKLDSGAFGSVYRGMNNITHKEVAIKVLDLASIERDECSSRVKEIRRRLAKSESQMMMKVDSDHVMKCYDVYQNKWLKIMVIEYCNGGTLAEEIYKKGRLPEKEAIEVLKQIILGVSAMHEQGIIHRDLKADNIMSHNGIYKIVDLGFAKLIPRDSQTFNTTLGTIITMAPEVMRKQKYGLKADIWSIGIIFYEMVYGRIPYEPMKAPDMYEQIIQKNIFPNNGMFNGYRPSDPVLNLMKKILVVDQKQRLDWSQLISQEIFRQKGLPDKYRVSVSIDHLKVAPEVPTRREEEFLEKLKPEESITEKEQVQISKLKKHEKDKLRAKIDRTDDNIVAWARDNHLQCLKTELILKEIIIPIELNNIFNLSQRKVVELMYLLSARCYLNMSFVMDKLEHQDHAIVQNLKRTVRDLYESVSEKFFSYGGTLTEKENLLGSIIGDRFSKIFNGEEIKRKDKFLVGIQNSEFRKEEQIVFTFEKYLAPLLEEMSDKDLQKNKHTVKLMKYYVKINNITLDDTREQKFAEVVEKMIR